MNHKGPSSVVIIGIAGGSGSGKTTLARMIQANLTDQFCGRLPQDAYYLDQSETFDYDGGRVNFDHPESIEFDLLLKHLGALKRGEDIFVPQYDFALHRRRLESTYFPWRPVVILDGILILVEPRLRELMDLSLFVDTHEDLRFQRRLHRDTRERGRTPEGVRDQFFSQVKPMHDLFVEPSRKFASKVISGERSFGPVIDEIVFGLQTKTPLLTLPST